MLRPSRSQTLAIRCRYFSIFRIAPKVKKVNGSHEKMHAAKRAANTFQSSAQRTPQFCIMMIGFHKQRTILCKCSKNAVIASQCAHWRGNPFPFTRVVFTETLRKSQRLGCGLLRRFAPRNDSAGRNPVIKIHMLIKTDNHNINSSAERTPQFIIYHFAFCIFITRRPFHDRHSESRRPPGAN